MAILFELSPELETNDEGIEILEDLAAIDARIREWLGTPAGTLADMPNWGNLLSRFKFEPMDTNTEMEIEISVVQKIRSDIRDIFISGISVAYVEIDMVRIYFDVGVGQLVGGTVTL